MKLRWLREGGRARAPWLAALIAAAAVAWLLAQQFKASLPIRAAAAAAAVVIPILLTELITEVFRQDDERTKACLEHLRGYSRRRGVPKVSALRDLTALGVTQARGSWRNDVSPYVPRDKDDKLDELLDDSVFVLLIGDSKVGKSRMAAEAMRRKFPDRALIIPDSAASLPALLDAGLDFENSVVWLDDLQRYLEKTGLGRLLDYLVRADSPRRVTILATIREKAYSPYMPTGELESPYWSVLQRAAKLRIERLLSAAERDRAVAAFNDPDMAAALANYGLAEYLSAGPDLAERLENGWATEPVGAMVVAAVVDWSRTGLHRPVPQAILVGLVESYADRLPIQSPGPSDIGTALAWAQKPVYGASQLLSVGAGGFTVFDYILDHAPQAAIPDPVWDAALATARDDELVQVGLAAHEQNRLDIAVRAFEIAVTVDTPLVDPALAAYNYALILEKLDKRAEAEEYYRKASAAGHVEAACAAGRLLEARHESVEAERYYEVAASAGSAEGAFALGMVLRERDYGQALRWLDQAAQAGHVEAACAAGRLLEGRGELAEAERFYEVAASAGSAEGAFALGLVLRERDPGRALHWLDQAAAAGHVEAAYAASRLLDARNQPAEAERYRQMAAAAGQPVHGRVATQKPKAAVRLSGHALRTAEAIVDHANLLEEQMAGCSDTELQERTSSFRRRLQHGETLDELAPEAFALAREAASRVCGLNCSDVQLADAAALHLGYVAEMHSSEGRAVATMLAAYLNALSGDPVHVVSADETTARRDASLMAGLYKFLGLDTGLIVNEMLEEARRVAYRAAVTYSGIDELTFDYLRDNMRWPGEEPVQRGTHFAIVDVADHIMIDGATQPVALTKSDDEPSHWFRDLAPIAKQLRRDVHYKVDEKARRVDLIDAGIEAIEDWLGIDNLYSSAHAYLVPYLDRALEAKELHTRGEHYVVSDGRILLLDSTTGNIHQNMRHPDGLHQSLEAKEGVAIRPNTVALARIHRRAYLRLYKKLAGLSGTATADADTFRQLYALEVVDVPTSRPASLVRHDDLVFNSDAGRWAAVADLVEDHHGTGQPVVVDVSSNERADTLSAILSARGISHQVLKAPGQSATLDALADAGRKGAITIGTNLGQYTVDIPLGGRQGAPQDHDDVVALGGIMVVGSERREARRDDERLCGLTTGGGEPGECIFMIGKPDAFAKSVRWWAPMGLAGDLPVSSPMVNRAIKSLQKMLADVRRADLLVELDYVSVFEDKRAVLYKLRDRATGPEGIDELARGYLHDVVDSYLASYALGVGPRQRDLDAIRSSMVALLGNGFDSTALEAGPAVSRLMARSRRRSLATSMHDAAQRAWDRRAAELGPDVWTELERQVFATVIDRRWSNYIDDLDELREASTLARFKGRDPLVEYKDGADTEFEKLERLIKEELVVNMMNLAVSVVDAGVQAKEAVPTTSEEPEVRVGVATVIGGALPQIEGVADSS